MRLSSEPLSKERHMEAKDYLAYIVNEIHTTIVATVDDEGLPVTAAIDMMDSDENSLYFLTAKGKGFYDRLKKRGFVQPLKDEVNQIVYQAEHTSEEHN